MQPVRSSPVHMDCVDAQCSRTGFQEALIRQVNDLQELLGDEWDWVSLASLSLSLKLVE